MNDKPSPPPSGWRLPTLTLSGEEQVAVVAGAGVAARRVDADLGGVAVVAA